MHLSLALYKGMMKNNHAKTVKARTKCHTNGDKISHVDVITLWDKL